jgi:hypothetical protein
MREPGDDEDPYGSALDALQAVGLMPPISGYRAGELEGRDGLGILEYHGALSADERERIHVVMGTLPYVLDEVSTDPDGTMRRVADGRVIGSWMRGPRPNGAPKR